MGDRWILSNHRSVYPSILIAEPAWRRTIDLREPCGNYRPALKSPEPNITGNDGIIYIYTRGGRLGGRHLKQGFQTTEGTRRTAVATEVPAEGRVNSDNSGTSLPNNKTTLFSSTKPRRSLCLCSHACRNSDSVTSWQSSQLPRTRAIHPRQLKTGTPSASFERQEGNNRVRRGLDRTLSPTDCGAGQL